ncbi:MAG: 23S rRNA (uracil(1939)-C(5))-methyltransferase RlmD [Lachnospiraceae bacterium]|nr:23S rRNA (uracil(1939)-C(5))-methyltransferase RlmD [Lachnospiraceae bacterium]
MESEKTIYKKNDMVTVEITDMDEKGQGIGKAEGFTLFVKDAVIGDVIEAKVMKAKTNYAFAKLMKVVKPSPDRVPAECPMARACGGCQLQEMSYEAELRFKENKVKNNLVRLGGFDEAFIESIREPIVGMKQPGEEDFSPYRYRNKAQYPVGEDRDGNPVAGFYAGRTHDIIPNTDCLLGREVNQKILLTVLTFMKTYGVKSYDETQHKGLIRHILIREGFKSGEIMVCLIVNGKSIPKEELLCEQLVNEVPKIAGICLNTNTDKTNVIMGDRTRVLWGKESISDELCGINYAISARSFYQVNPVQAERLYSKAVEYASLTGTESVWDLYCGIGTISLCMAKKAGKVYGVEIVPEAIEDAKANALRNGISNAEFFVGKAEEVLPAFYERANDKDMLSPDIIVVDPPRKGCDEKCLETMLAMEPRRIVYVSCDSATLARDLKILCSEKYELKAWQAFDQFSRTVHVETVCLLSNRKPDARVKIDVDLEDYYRIKDEQKKNKASE